MSGAELLAKLEGQFRPIITRLNPELVAFIYSSARKSFLKILSSEKPREIKLPEHLSRNMWGLEFQSPLMNAAGMFKNGHGYYTSAYQGAGAYLTGTTTSKPRDGNRKIDIKHPFMPYPMSGAASNWMGLPNDGHDAVAKRLSKIEKVRACPIGASLSISPDESGLEGLNNLVNGIQLYIRANVDFIEINESCPNVPHGHSNLASNGLDQGLIDRLEYLSLKLLKNNSSKVPLVVKFSTDTSPNQIPTLIDLLINLGYSGINLGNTSVEYNEISSQIAESDFKNYSFFTRTFGGGISGKPLKSKSLNLCRIAREYVGKSKLSNEFHVIRTGGIFDLNDILESNEIGIPMNQWFTGYFEAFARWGHKLYIHTLL